MSQADGAARFAKLHTPAGTLTILYSFAVNGRAAPLGRLLLASDGNFHGTTEDGGAYTKGTIFKLTPDGTETVLYSFGNPGIPDDPVHPEAGLIQGTDGSLYGTSRDGGTANDGTVFKVTP